MEASRQDRSASSSSSLKPGQKLFAETKKIPQPRLARISSIVIIIQLFDLFMHQTTSLAQQVDRQQQQQPKQDNVVAEMEVLCHSDAIVLLVNTNAPFNGMLYARDAASNPNCLSEFHSSTNMTFRLPLKSCGTLSAELDDGVEFFNTIVVQPHMRLMTNQGKGYHIRCKYQTRERTIANTHFNVSAAFHLQNGPQSSMAPLLATASMPMCTMKIYRIDQDSVAGSVKVGDKLVMVIEVDKQDMYGMRITNCVVRDGMNKAEQQLINDSGCPVDEAIMPRFEYEHNNTRAAVAFRAHKFPHTSSIYYQCNVRLCINDGGCEQVSCPSGNGSDASASGGVDGGARRKRFIGHHHLQQHGKEETQQLKGGAGQVGPDHVPAEKMDELPIPSELKSQGPQEDGLSFDVYSGLYVNDVIDMSGSNSDDPDGKQVLPARRSQANNSTPTDPTKACLTIGKASLIVVVASLTSVALVLLIACQTGLLVTGEDGTRDLAYHQETSPRARRMSGQLHQSAASQGRCYAPTGAYSNSQRSTGATGKSYMLPFYHFN